MIADLEQNGYGALFAIYDTSSTPSWTIGEICRYTGVSFACSPVPPAAVGPTRQNFGDVDGDGRPDLVTLGFGGSSNV